MVKTTRRVPLDRSTTMRSVDRESTNPERGPVRDDHRAEIAPGMVVDETYRIERRLGTGGMSQVMLARDLRLDRDVALKFLGDGLLLHPSWRERFLVEAKNTARVRHPNVVQVHAFGTFQGWPYFVMDHIDGVTLSEWRTQHERPSAREIAGIVTQLAAGIGAIHREGLVHHDIKPMNALIGRDGRVVLMDLGLSRLASRMDAMTALAGTPRYMAPEQLLGHPPSLDASQVAERTDVYQLGVTTFELLVGAVPFDEISLPELVARHRAAPPPPPSAVRPDLMPEIDRVMGVVLARDPRDRYASADAFAEAFERAAAGERNGASIDADWSYHRPLRVLVAEDDPSQLEATCALLARELPAGTHIHRAADGVQALHALEELDFDVLLLDLHMPWMDGNDVVDALQSMPWGRPCTIVLSAMGGAEDWRALRAKGVDAMVLKPFDIDEVVATMRRHLPPSAQRRAS